MTLGLVAMILWTSMARAFMDNLESNIVDVEVGDVQVFAPEYRDRPSIFERIEGPSELVESIGALGHRASARLLAGGLAAAGESSAGVSLRGIEIEEDAMVSEVSQRLAEGRWLNNDDPGGVVLGRRLARTLNVGLGAEVVLLSQASDGSIANGLYTVKGLLQGISEATDRGGVFMTQQAFLELFALAGGAHQVLVRTAEDRSLGAAASEIRDVAGALEVLTWRELFPTLATMLDSVEGLMYVLFLVVYLSIAILLINATLMAVFERIKELGLLKAIGLPPGQVVALIVWEGVFQAGMATALGLGLCVPLLLYFNRIGIDLGSLGGGGSISISGIGVDPVLRGVLEPSVVVGPLSAMLVIVFLSMLYPALKAARINPIEAMRHR